MAIKILKNVEIYYARLGKPQSYKGGPERWSIQLRTTDEAQADDWEDRGFTVKKIRPKKDEEKFEPYWRINLSRKKFKADGSERDPVKVLDGKLDEVERTTIGNGSKGNIQYLAWSMMRDGEEISGFVLNKIQLTKHVVYEYQGDGEEDETFDTTDTEVVQMEATEGDDEGVY